MHGVRGSYPVDGERYRRYGGSTSCFSVERPGGLLIIDGGTGLAGVGEALQARATLPPITILLTHVHLDHVIGIPTFKPLYRPDAHITFLLPPEMAGAWRRAITAVVGKPLWPVDLLQCGASIRFDTLPQERFAWCGASIAHCAVSHPQGCMSYRIELPGRTVVLATDREHGDPALDPAFLAFCLGADVLLHDAQYTPDEFAARRGWGHSTWEQSVEVARASGVKRLVLVSHDPTRSDDEIDRLVEQATARFPNTVGGSDRMAIP